MFSNNPTQPRSNHRMSKSLSFVAVFFALVVTVPNMRSQSSTPSDRPSSPASACPVASAAPAASPSASPRQRVRSVKRARPHPEMAPETPPPGSSFGEERLRVGEKFQSQARRFHPKEIVPAASPSSHPTSSPNSERSPAASPTPQSRDK